MKKRNGQPVIGGSGLLVIFGVLCLTVFALLSLHTVLAEQRLSRASAQAVTDWYAADMQAQEIFARLRSGELPPEVRARDGIYYYEVRVSDTQTLEAAVTEREEGWQVLSWQTVAHPPEGELTLPVWPGEN